MYPFSFFMRIVMKFVSDFTGVVHLRHPGELGGLYWSVNMVMGLAVSAFGIFSYVSKLNDDCKIEGGELSVAGCERYDKNWKIMVLMVGTMGGLWALSMGAILVSMNPSSLKSFTSRQTGGQLTRNLFRRGKNDETKAHIVFFNEASWWKIRGDVGDWFRDNWKDWEDEKPDWFNSVFKNAVPKELLDTQRSSRGNGGSSGRNISQKESGDGSLRLSLREGLSRSGIMSKPTKVQPDVE